MTTDKLRTVGASLSIPLSNLQLDTSNPRLISEDDTSDQNGLAATIAIKFEALEVARSIARNGFFANEPLIVISTEEANRWVVVEGNRRLTALLGLADPATRASFFQHEEWDLVSRNSGITLDTEIPCVEIDDRSQVASLIGYRHISGILDWTPYAQASFIAHLVENEGHPFDVVAEMIGKKRADVANLYRNFAIARQASASGVDSSQLEGAFSLLTVAMSSPHLRDHIGAPSGRDIEPTETPIPATSLSNLNELVTWIFGSDSGRALIEDSREISSLGKIVANEEGLRAIRTGEATTVAAGLERIAPSAVDPAERVRKNMNAAISALRMAAGTVQEGVQGDELISLLGDIEDEVESLRALLVPPA